MDRVLDLSRFSLGNALIIEPNGDFRRQLRELIGHVFQDVVEVATYSEALAKLEPGGPRFDMVITELLLDLGSGLHILKSIRMGLCKSVRADVCVAICTTSDLLAPVKKAVLLNANGYFRKPMGNDYLKASLIRARSRIHPLNHKQYVKVELPDLPNTPASTRDLPEPFEQPIQSFEIPLQNKQ
jgi:ActR/RegA family two-component response regulator